MEAHDLIAEAKGLLGKAEALVKDAEHVEATQLRIAVNRIQLFVEEHSHLAKAEEPIEAPRRSRKPKTEE